MKTIMQLIVPLLIFTSAVIISSCSKNSPTQNQTDLPTNTHNIETGVEIAAATQGISAGGGKIHISSVDTLINGLEITVPANSFTNAQTFTVSYAQIRSHTFGEFIRPISPLITISNGGGYADSVMTVRVPISLPDSAYPVAFFYDDVNHTFEPVPMLSCDKQSVTILTKHFDVGGIASGLGKHSLFSGVISRNARLLITMITKKMVDAITIAEPIIRTGYKPGVDDWEFVNYGSYIAKRGHCAGQDLSSLWYFFEKKKKLGEPALHHRYDSVDVSPDKIWQDNPRGYKVASGLQSELKFDATMLRIYENIVGMQDDWTWDALVLAMYATHEPFDLGVYGFDSKGNNSAHDIIAYEIDALGGSIHVADPNYPGDLTRRVTYNGATFDIYNSGPNATDPGVAYRSVKFSSKTALADWGKIGTMWNNVFSLNYNPGFVNYNLRVENGGFNLTDHITVGTDTIIVSVNWTDPAIACFEIFDLNGNKVAPVNKTYIYTPRDTLVLKPGENILGFAIYAAISPSTPTGTWDISWNDFKWLHITYVPKSVSILPIVMSGVKNQQYVWSGVVKSRPANVRYEWNFGDGSQKFIATNDSVSYHTYANDGLYTITLDAFDASNSTKIGTATATASIYSTASITSVYPTEVSYAMPVYISGKNFGATQGTNNVEFESYPARSIVSWGDNEIIATVPEQFTGGRVYVKIGGTRYVGDMLSTNPEITTVKPDSEYAGQVVTIRGKMFGLEQGHSRVSVGIDTATIVSWSDTAVAIVVPDPKNHQYGKLNIQITLGNGIRKTYSNFSVLENVLETLHRTKRMTAITFTGMMTIDYSPNGNETKNQSVWFSTPYETGAVITWNGTAFHFDYTYISASDTLTIRYDGNVSDDGKTLQNITARRTFSTPYSSAVGYGYSEITEFIFQNVPLDHTISESNVVEFDASGTTAQDCTVSIKHERIRQDVVIIKYISAEWNDTQHPPKIIIPFN